MVRIEGLPHSADIVPLKNSSTADRFGWDEVPYDILVLRVYVKKNTVNKEVLAALTGKDRPTERRTIVIGVVDREKTKTTLGNRIINLFIEEDFENDIAEEKQAAREGE